MREKLESKGVYDQTNIEETIEYLKESSYLNDRRFAATLADSRIRNKAWGRHKIALDLKRRKIPDEVVKEVVAGIDDEIEVRTAEAAVEKWMRRGCRTSPLSHKEFERGMRHLASRGFSAATSITVLKQHRDTGAEEQ